MGVVLTEAMHVFSLNFVAAVILPRVGALVPMVVPCIVISTIRSPFAIAPGPALNLIPVTAAAVLHGGLEAYRAQCLGCGLGMLLCYLAVKRLRVLQNHGFTSAWSARGFTQSDNEPAPAKRVTRTSKKAEDFVARKKANEEFDPNALASGDFVIKGVTAHRLSLFLTCFLLCLSSAHDHAGGIIPSPKEPQCTQRALLSHKKAVLRAAFDWWVSQQRERGQEQEGLRIAAHGWTCLSGTRTGEEEEEEEGGGGGGGGEGAWARL